MATVQKLLKRRNKPSDAQQRKQALKDSAIQIAANDMIRKRMEKVIQNLEGPCQSYPQHSHFEKHLRWEFKAKIEHLKVENYNLGENRNDMNYDTRSVSGHVDNAMEFLDKAFKEGQAALIEEARRLDDHSSILAIIWQLLDTLSPDSLDQLGAYDDGSMGRSRHDDTATYSASQVRLKRCLIRASKAAWVSPTDDTSFTWKDHDRHLRDELLPDPETWEFHDGQLLEEPVALWNELFEDLDELNDEEWVERMTKRYDCVRVWDPIWSYHGRSEGLFNFFPIRAGQAAMDYIFPSHPDVLNAERDLSIQSIRNAFLGECTGYLESFDAAIIPWNAEEPDGKRYRIFFALEHMRKFRSNFHMREIKFLSDFRPSARLLYWHYLKLICWHRKQLDVNKPGNGYDDIRGDYEFPRYDGYESIQATYRKGLGDPMHSFRKFGEISSGKTEVILANEPREEYHISHFYDFTRWPKTVKGEFGKDWKYWGNGGKWIRKSVLEHLNALMEHPIADANPEVHGIADEPNVQELKRVARDINIGLQLDE